jgi:hypothetical protein
MTISNTGYIETEEIDDETRENDDTIISLVLNVFEKTRIESKSVIIMSRLHLSKFYLKSNTSH